MNSAVADVQKLVDRLSAQRGIKITYTKIDGANHFFDNHMGEVVDVVEDHIGSEAACGFRRIIEGIDHRQTVAETIGQAAGDQIAGFTVVGVSGQTIFDQPQASRQRLPP